MKAALVGLSVNCSAFYVYLCSGRLQFWRAQQLSWL